MPNDAPLSPLLDPLEGLSRLNCGKLGLEGPSRLPTLERGRRACQKSRDQTRKRDNYLVTRSCIQNQPQVGQNSFCTLLGVGTSHRHLDTLDSPRPGLGGSHHLPPYSILYSSARRLHLNGSFSRDSQSGQNPKPHNQNILKKQKNSKDSRGCIM